RDTETNTRTSENLPPKGRRKKQSVEQSTSTDSPPLQNAGTVLTVNDFAEKLMIKLPPTQSSKRAQSIHATVETPKDPKQDNSILSTPPEVAVSVSVITRLLLSIVLEDYANDNQWDWRPPDTTNHQAHETDVSSTTKQDQAIEIYQASHSVATLSLNQMPQIQC
ncbi:MAG: hypothetical protein NXY57DRAFT_959345, partial [Lentinula lateritia]